MNPAELSMHKRLNGWKPLQTMALIHRAAQYMSFSCGHCPGATHQLIRCNKETIRIQSYNGFRLMLLLDHAGNSSPICH